MMDIPLGLIKESFLSHGPFIPIARILSTAYSFISCSDQPDSVVLAKAARVPDVTIAGTYTHFSRITNPIDPTPAWENVGVSFSLPIPISALNVGAVQAGYYRELQAEKILQAAKLQAESDVRRAYQRYVLANQEVQLFDAELLKDSAQIYKSRLFKMEKGQMALLDVLDAHQALVQLYLDYYNALSRRAKALVELEQAAGIWDVDF